MLYIFLALIELPYIFYLLLFCCYLLALSAFSISFIHCYVRLLQLHSCNSSFASPFPSHQSCFTSSPALGSFFRPVTSPCPSSSILLTMSRRLISFLKHSMLSSAPVVCGLAVLLPCHQETNMQKTMLKVLTTDDVWW